jgi:hypothetical protein
MAGLPCADAGPSQVRAYLVNILVHKYEASSEFAQTIADLWQLGRGSDLRHANGREFNQIFGKPVGRYLHETVIDDLYAEWRTSSSGITNLWAMVIAGVTAVFFLVQAYYSRSATQARKKVAFASLLCGPILVISGSREVMRFDSSVVLVVMAGFFLTCWGLCVEIDKRVNQGKDDREKHQ